MQENFKTVTINMTHGYFQCKSVASSDLFVELTLSATRGRSLALHIDG